MSAARPADYRRGFYAFGAAAITLFLLVNLHGPCIQVLFGHDDLAYLAAAWKVHCGLWPHADYHSALGALDAWLFAAGMWLLGPTASVFPFCLSLVGVLLGLIAWLVARPRLPAFPAALFALTQMVVAAAPHHLRFPWYIATYANHYNRQGYGLISILLLLLFLPRRAGKTALDEASASPWDGRVAGAILGVLLFLKISYFMAAVGLCVYADVFGRSFSRAQRWNLLAAFAVVLTACLALIRFDALAMWNDLRLAAGARTGDPETAFNLGRYLVWLQDAWIEVALLAVCQSLLGSPWVFRRTAAACSPAAPSWIEFIGVLGASMFICMSNAPIGNRSETPLLTCWIFVLLGYALRNRQTAAAAPPGLTVLCGLGGVLWVLTFGPAFVCLCWSVSPWPTTWQQTALRRAPVLDAHPLERLCILGLGSESPMPFSYVSKVNDGLHLLRRLGGTHRVETIDMVNPFPFALQWRPARGSMWCWQYGFTFNETSCPAAQEAFGDADVLMVPKFPGEPATVRALLKIYGAYFRAHYQLVEESAQWSVLQRR
jgi:hypothetical protein